MKARPLLIGLVLPFVLASAALAADADPVETQLRTQLRATVTQLRELQDQQATLQAQKTAAEQERDALKKKPQAAPGPSRKALAAAAALRRDLAGARQEAEAGKQAAAQSQAQLAALRQQLDQVQASLRAVQTQNNEMRATLASTNSTLQACELKNVQLIGLSSEVLDRYSKVGLGTAMAAKEPFTGLRRVQLQNLAQGYEDRLRAGRYDPARDKAPPKPKPADNVTEPSPH